MANFLQAKERIIMRNLLKQIDAVLNNFTMYKVVLYGLMGLIAVAELLALLGVLSMSALGILMSLVVLGSVCFIVNELLGRVVRVSVSTESYLITASILTLILPPIDSLRAGLLVALCGVIAMVSKYLIAWRGSHIFNPAAFAAFVVSVTGILPVTWWVATPALVPGTVLLGLAVLRKQRQYGVFAIFGLIATAMLLLNGLVLHDLGLTAGALLKNALLSWPIIFMGSIMLTEPLTMPASKVNQALFAVLVGVIFGAQVHIGPLSSTPQLALLVGNLFALLVGVSFSGMLKVTKVEQLAKDIYEVSFARPAALRFRAGQYMEWTLTHPKADVRGNRRTFSVASGPQESSLRIAVRTSKPGSSYKAALINLRPGDRVRASHVAGSFTLPARSQPLLFIAGGIGITPFVSMIHALMATGKKYDVQLVYIARSEQHFVYRSLLQAAKAHGVQTEYVVGRLDADALVEMLPSLADRQVYISGPDAMVTSYSQALKKQVPRRRIHTDHFSGY